MSLCPSLELCPLSGGRSLFIASGAGYHGMVKKLVLKLKYDGDCLLAEDLSLLLARAWTLIAAKDENGGPGLVPVPLHWSRLFRRGFNQSELLSKALSRSQGLACLPSALRRVKLTTAQLDLGRAERFANLSGAFQGNRKVAGGACLVLVDDIYTSGATLSAAGETLLAAGARQVFALTVARAHIS